MGAGRVEQTTSAGKIGAAVGDFGATVQGTGEALSGGTTEAGGVVYQRAELVSTLISI